MRLYAIGDLHLAIGAPEKMMDIFHGWEDYIPILEENWRRVVTEEDTVVIAGDISWGMSLPQSLTDFQWLDKLPGTKILSKGNHDYWWNSMKKMTDFFAENGLNTLHILHNNHYAFGQYGICGTRGWVNTGTEEPENAKVLAREAQRLEVSIQSALHAGLQPVVFLHYPPIYGTAYNYSILDVLYRYEIQHCYYGHLHGGSHKKAIIGKQDGVDFHLISSDYLQFYPEMIL